MLTKTTLDPVQVRHEAEELACQRWGDNWTARPVARKLVESWVAHRTQVPDVEVAAAVSRRSYLLQVVPQQERSVAASLQESGFDAYVPREPKRVRVGHHYQIVMKPMLSGYVFPIFDEARDRWQMIGDIRGVWRLFMWNERPVPIPEQAIQHLHDEEAHLIAHGKRIRKAPIPVKFGPGAWVQLTDMPWTGFIGQVHDWLVYKSRIRVAVDLFGRQSLIELSVNQVRAV